MLHVERTEEGVFIPLKSGNHAEMRVKICGSQQEFLQAYKILSSSAIHLKNQFGLSYWLPYPSFEEFLLQQQNDKTTFLFYLKEEPDPFSTITVTQTPRAYYSDSNWPTCDQLFTQSEEKCLYFGKFAVAPARCGQGFAKIVMQFVEYYAISILNLRFLRADYAIFHPFLASFYSKLGFVPGQQVPLKHTTVQCIQKHVVQ